MPITFLETRAVPLDQLTKFPGNAKRGDVDAIRASLRASGQYRSLVVRQLPEALVILAGNHTFDAIGLEGGDHARCEIIECSDDEATRINVADNRISDLGDYDTKALLDLLDGLDDLTGIGYTDAEVDEMIRAADYFGDQATAFLSDIDQPAPVSPAPAAPAAQPAPSSPAAAPAAPGSPEPAAASDPAAAPSSPPGAPAPAPAPAADPAPAATPVDYVQLSWTFDTEQRDLVRAAVRAAQQRWQCSNSAEAVVAMARYILNETEGKR